MISLARLLLFVAALAYGAMPVTGMSAMAMPVVQMTDHSGGLDRPASVAKAMVDVDCPHSGVSKTVADAGEGAGDSSKPMKINGHCAACLTLPANPAFADGGQAARAAEAGLPMPQLVSQMAAPVTPPPRA
ncbi:hypothetical protein ASE36_04805 [Rhizobium sp. Root274]|uniref:hypothetical protein n=1 Tax=unclassified Rhizobium TaxID=2613769 RepID=UPI000715155A|nr:MULTISPECIES: hypothetical protein [unclassified Rhizobium]KQW31563.1 hypothetical protein ASC71_04810 [Rhizobium sp. Root1240]KRD33103.1 hypothetical protein ASE36_04805 [Rhizobium sp. Root274]